MGIGQKLFYISLLLAVFASCATAQNYPKQTKNGENYYVYTVQPGNTVYAISKEFSVEPEDVLKANPDAKEGLDIGQKLFIPIDKIDKRTARKSDIKVEGENLLHKVQKKETLFSISREYGVNINDLIELNPGKTKTLKTGMVLKIPVEKSESVDRVILEPARNDTFMVHQVEKGETAYSLAKEYGITLDSLNNANAGFQSGMKVGQWIVVPKYKESFLAKMDTLETDSAKMDFKYSEAIKQKYNIALMLPFELALNDSLDKALNEGNDLYVLTEIALDYYRGAKIALDSLKKLGLTVDVYVYDVGEDLVNARETMRRPELRDMDIIFGPMHKTSLAIVSDNSKKRGTYLVSPNSFSNDVFEDNPYLMRAEASRETLVRYLANYVAIQHQDDNVLMINSESAKDWPFRKTFKVNYNQAVGTFPNSWSDSLRSVSKEITDPEEVDKWLRKDTLNVLVVPSNSLAFVSDFMTRLSRVDPEYRIQVYGLDNWLRFENIDAEYKNRFHLRLVVPSYVDYSADRVKKFLEEYRDRYAMEPSQYGYGFLGYDLTLFFGKALQKYGLGFPRAFDHTEMDGVMADYRFGRSTSGKEFENKSVFILEYDDYAIHIVN